MSFRRVTLYRTAIMPALQAMTALELWAGRGLQDPDERIRSKCLHWLLNNPKPMTYHTSWDGFKKVTVHFDLYWAPMGIRLSYLTAPRRHGRLNGYAHAG